jgi:hypothetical protein
VAALEPSHVCANFAALLGGLKAGSTA